MLSEKRRSQRKLLAVPASIAREGIGAAAFPLLVHTLNLSSGGALIECQERLYRGETCTFAFETGRGNGDVQGRVVWTEQDDKGLSRAGIAFRNLSPEQEYLIELHMASVRTSNESHQTQSAAYVPSAREAFIPRHTTVTVTSNRTPAVETTPATEKRQAQRTFLSIPVSVAPLDAGKFTFPLLVRTLNLSISGALIQTRERLQTGESFTFVFETGRGNGDVQARVVWTRADDEGTFHSGLAFRNLTAEQKYIIVLHINNSKPKNK